MDGVDAEDLVDWAAMQLAAEPQSFGARLLEWAALFQISRSMCYNNNNDTNNSDIIILSGGPKEVIAKNAHKEQQVGLGSHHR